MKFTLRKRFGAIHIGIALLTIVFISLSSTLGYYFYSDDYSMLYHLQNNITPEWPYAFVPLIFKPIYKFFGLIPEAYALFGVITYFFLVISVYILCNVLLKKKLIAFFAAAFFSTGYIGLDQFTQLAVSTVNNLSNIFICVSLIVYLQFIQAKKKLYYFLTLAIFTLTMIVFPFRVFPLLLFMPAAHVLFTLNLNLKSSIIKQLFFIILLQAPFLIIAYFSGVFSYGSDPEVKTVVPTFTLWKSIFVLFTPEFLSEIPRIIGRFILPEPIMNVVFKTVITQTQYFLIGSFFILLNLTIGIFFFFKKKYKILAKAILFFLIMTVGGFIGNLVLLPSFDSNGSVNRYLNLSFIGYSALFSTMAYVLIANIPKRINRKPTLFYSLFMIIIVAIFSAMSISYEKNILSERSIPSRNFYKQLLNNIPNISDKTIFYFDYADYHPVYSRFGNIMVGAYLPREAALAVHYRKKIEEIKIANNFEEFLSNVVDNKYKFYTFYYGQNGLVSTTDKLKNLLQAGESVTLPTGNVVYKRSFFTPGANIRANTVSFYPLVLKLSLKANPVDNSEFKFPFFGPEINSSGHSDIEKYHLKHKESKGLVFQYIISRKKYYEKAKIETSLTHDNFQNLSKEAIDKNDQTYWLSNPDGWRNKNAWLNINLGEARNISKLVLTSQSNARFPKGYRLSTSPDGMTWHNINRTQNINTKNGMNVLFPPVLSQFVRLEINSTIEGLAPALSEIEIVEDEYKNVDRDFALRLENNPFEYISDENDLALTYNYLFQAATFTLATVTDRDGLNSESYNIEVPLYLDGQYHDYVVPIAPRGTVLKEIEISMNFPADFDIQSLSIEYPKLK